MSVRLAALLLAAVQLPGSPVTPPSPGGAQVDVEPVVALEGTPRESVRELVRASIEGEHARAMGLARALVLHDEETGLEEGLRADAYYAAGTALVLAGEDLALDVRGEAEPLLRTAAAAAGRGELRLDAYYNAALPFLHEAERRRAEIPELGGGGTPVAAPVPTPSAVPSGTPGLQAGQEPDPLALARASYRQARDRFVDCLRLEEGTARGDVRANLELIQRRLRELDEIEEQREQDQQEQQDPGEESEDSEEGEEGEESEDQQDDEQQDEQQDEEDQQDPSEQEDQQDQEQPEPEEREDPEQAPPPEPEEQEQPDEQQQPEQPPEPPEERYLTREEVMRLLERLEEIEEQAQEVQQALRRHRRIDVERDW